MVELIILINHQIGGILEVIKTNTYIMQRCTGSTSIAVRISWDGGAEWLDWKTYN